MTNGKRQRDFYYFDIKNGNIRGYFYHDGKRIQKILCRFSDINLNQNSFNRDGKLIISKTKAERINSRLMAIWSKKAREVDLLPRRPKKAWMETLFQEWLDISAAQKSPQTVAKHYLPASNAYMKIVGNHELTSFDTRKLDKFTIGLQAQGLSSTSINMKLRTIRTFINWAKERDFGFNPRIRWSKVFVDTVGNVPGVLNRDQYQRLYNRIKAKAAGGIKKDGRGDSRQQRYYLCHERYLMVATGTGCRLSEIFWLTWKNIDLEKSLLHIKQSQSFTPKPKKESARFLPGFLVEYLAAQRADCPEDLFLFDNGKGKLAYSAPHAFSTAFARHFKALGITGVKATHGFRAGFATTLRNELNVDLKTIQDLMGLSNVKVLDHYFSDVDIPQMEAIEKLNQSVKKSVEEKKQLCK